jgi:hypothetical protein
MHNGQWYCLSRSTYITLYTYSYVYIFMLQGIIHKLCVVTTEPYLFIYLFFHFINLLIFSMFIVRVKKNNKNTRLKLLHAQYSFVRKVPVVVIDQTCTYTHTHIHTHGHGPIRSVDKGEFGPHR